MKFYYLALKHFSKFYYNVLQQEKIDQMLFKISYKNQLHILNNKVSHSQLLKFISKNFIKLPKNYTISYMDEQNDKIMLRNQQDLQILYTQTHIKSTKIIIQEQTEDKFISLESDDDQVQQIKPEIPQDKNQILNDKKYKQEIQQENKIIKLSPVDLNQMVKSQIQNLIPEITQKLKKQLKKDQNKNKNLTVHNRVTCDGCGISPVIGYRYKCSVCHNFDYCQKCQATIQHDHPFLKIKNQKQYPVHILCTLQTNIEQQVGLQVNGNFLNVGELTQFLQKKQTNVKKEETMEKQKKQNEQNKIKQNNKIKEKQQLQKKALKLQEQQREIRLAQQLIELLDGEFNQIIQFVRKNNKLQINELFEKYISQNHE